MKKIRGEKFKMNGESQKFEALCNQILEVLLWSLIEDDEGTKLTHRELSIRLDQEVLAVNTPRYLEAIGYFCDRHNIPILPVLVVNEKTKFPGAWFNRLYQQFYKNSGVNVEALYANELDRIYQFGYWDKIASDLKLDAQLTMRLL